MSEWKGTPRTRTCFPEPTHVHKVLTSPPWILNPQRLLPVHPPTSHQPYGRITRETITTSRQLHFLLSMFRPPGPRFTDNFSLFPCPSINLFNSDLASELSERTLRIFENTGPDILVPDTPAGTVSPTKNPNKMPSGLYLTLLFCLSCGLWIGSNGVPPSSSAEE
ncbi:hypothetical protein AMECASPLE_027132 [Ameca splendens]|uniref:Uncharacterized protein n=1 Tax=Ameca splendens TaxID=208324 RepID=A0ABV0Z4M2_9TELE